MSDADNYQKVPLARTLNAFAEKKVRGAMALLGNVLPAQVVAVDRSPLRDDLMHHARVEFRPGDAFGFEPPRAVDWLLCDVIAAPERTAALLLAWLRRGWMGCRSCMGDLRRCAG